jgi:hypothetical protein
MSFLKSYNQQPKVMRKSQGESSETQGENSGRVDFFDAAEHAELMVKFVGEIRTANNRYKSRYVRAEIQDLSPNAQIRNIGVKNLNLKRTVLRKEVEALEASGLLQAQPYVIFGRGEATTQDGSAKYYKYEVLPLSEAQQRGLVNDELTA